MSSNAPKLPENEPSWQRFRFLRTLSSTAFATIALLFSTLSARAGVFSTDKMDSAAQKDPTAFVAKVTKNILDLVPTSDVVLQQTEFTTFRDNLHKAIISSDLAALQKLYSQWSAKYDTMLDSEGAAKQDIADLLGINEVLIAAVSKIDTNTATVQTQAAVQDAAVSMLDPSTDNRTTESGISTIRREVNNPELTKALDVYMAAKLGLSAPQNEAERAMLPVIFIYDTKGYEALKKDLGENSEDVAWIQSSVRSDAGKVLKALIELKHTGFANAGEYEWRFMESLIPSFGREGFVDNLETLGKVNPEMAYQIATIMTGWIEAADPSIANGKPTIPTSNPDTIVPEPASPSTYARAVPAPSMGDEATLYPPPPPSDEILKPRSTQASPNTVETRTALPAYSGELVTVINLVRPSSDLMPVLDHTQKFLQHIDAIQSAKTTKQKLEYARAFIAEVESYRPIPENVSFADFRKSRQAISRDEAQAEYKKRSIFSSIEFDPLIAEAQSIPGKIIAESPETRNVASITRTLEGFVKQAVPSEESKQFVMRTLGNEEAFFAHNTDTVQPEVVASYKKALNAAVMHMAQLAIPEIAVPEVAEALNDLSPQEIANLARDGRAKIDDAVQVAALGGDLSVYAKNTKIQLGTLSILIGLLLTLRLKKTKRVRLEPVERPLPAPAKSAPENQKMSIEEAYAVLGSADLDGDNALTEAQRVWDALKVLRTDASRGEKHRMNWDSVVIRIAEKDTTVVDLFPQPAQKIFIKKLFDIVGDNNTLFPY